MSTTREKEQPQEGDASLEISDEELSKVSGGVNGLRLTAPHGVRVALRDNPFNGLRSKTSR